MVIFGEKNVVFKLRFKENIVFFSLQFFVQNWWKNSKFGNFWPILWKTVEKVEFKKPKLREI